MKENIFSLYSPILEKEEAKKYHSMKWEEKAKFYTKLRKKYIRKLLDEQHGPRWPDTLKAEKAYKNLGLLAEYLILIYYTKQTDERYNHSLMIRENLERKVKELEKENEELKNNLFK